MHNIAFRLSLIGAILLFVSTLPLILLFPYMFYMMLLMTVFLFLGLWLIRSINRDSVTAGYISILLFSFFIAPVVCVLFIYLPLLIGFILTLAGSLLGLAQNPPIKSIMKRLLIPIGIVFSLILGIVLFPLFTRGYEPLPDFEIMDAKLVMIETSGVSIFIL